MNKILEEDFSYIANNTDLQCFNNKTVIVTGATGLLGSLFIRCLEYCSQAQKLNVRIIACVRNIPKFQEMFKEDLKNYSKLEYLLWDSSKIADVKSDVDFVLHTASITTSKILIQNPIEAIDTALCGTKHILNCAKIKKAKLIYISSMEVYGQINKEKPVTENDLGYLNLANVRNCYGESKRMCEMMCNAYHNEYDVNTIVARLAQTFGAGVSQSDPRVFGQFARSVIDGADIILHTDGSSEGNYCYTADVIRAILILFIKGVSGQTYNVSNINCHSSIKNMAEMVANELSNGKSRVIFDIPEVNKFGYPPKVHMILSSDKLRALGWNPEYNLKDMYERMINSWQ